VATLVPHAELAKLLGNQTMSTNARNIGELIDEVRSRLDEKSWDKMKRSTILVNGRNINSLQGQDTPLGPSDIVWMIVPSAGG